MKRALIVEDELAQWFTARLHERGLGEERERRIRDMAVQALMGMKS
jgi:hypothetical protein